MADASEAVAATSSRLAKIEVLAKALHDAGPAEVTIAVAYLSGELAQRQIGVGWATLRQAPAPAPAGRGRPPPRAGPAPRRRADADPDRGERRVQRDRGRGRPGLAGGP